MFYSFNGKYIGYSDLDISRLTDKINQSSFIIVTSYSYNFGISIGSDYILLEQCAISVSKIEEIKQIGDHVEGVDKEGLEISFK